MRTLIVLSRLPVRSRSLPALSHSLFVLSAGLLITLPCSVHATGQAPRQPEHAVTVQRPAAAELLRVMDSAWPAGEGVRIELSLTFHDGARHSRRQYRVLDDGAGRSLVEFLDPLSAGQKVLATPEALWFISPRIHRAIKVPAAQRLFGDASYGDVARVRWSRDYSASYDEPDRELMQGAQCWRLWLTAHRAAATYQSILLWMNVGNGVPVRAAYFAASGKLLRTAEFPDARLVNGRLVNDRWVLRSASAARQRTVLHVESAEPMRFHAHQFSRRWLELNR